jgi:hypothetical protein
MDIVLAIVPRIQDDFGYTPAGAALLKGSLQAQGFKTKIVDFNAQLEQTLTDRQLFAVSNFFMTNDMYHADTCELALQCIDKWAKQIIELNPRWLGVSVFSYNSQRAARLLSIRVKHLAPHIKIVIGGAGIATDHTFGESLMDLKIIDAMIRGEGEIALVKLLQGITDYPGINGQPPQQIDNLEALAYPNYDDYTLQSYTNRNGLVALPITGSRGCVRHCTFCDVASQWPNYKFRSGSDIANEIKHQVKQYAVTAFRFTDSLVNGSLKAFKQMITELAKFRSGLPDDQKFRWDGHFIIRGPREMSPETFDLMAQAGANVLLIGVESGSQAVRDHMKKGFTQEDLDYCMQQFARVGIRTRFLMIVGYPTETAADFKATMDMFTDYKKYADSGIINEVNLGLTLNLLPNTPLHRQQSELGIVQEANHINNWVCVHNPELDYKERLRRRIMLQEHIETLGYQVFEKKNYTKQLFVAWSEVSKIAKPILIDQFKFDRDQGGLVGQTVANRRVIDLVPA